MTIIIRDMQRPGGGMGPYRWKALMKGFPNKFGTGLTIPEALGKLVRRYKSEFGIDIKKDKTKKRTL